jgi:thiol-disulfide isomerase/thioredoxin
MTLERRYAVFVIGLSILLSSFAAPAQSRLNRAAKPPAESIRPIDANELKTLLKRSSSHPLLINFWATWCDPCRDEFPDLVRIDNQYRSKGLDFVAISLDDLKDINTEVPKFLREMHATMPVFLLNVPDPEPAIKIIDPQWAGSLPATFLYNAQGQIVYKHFGRINTAEVHAAIEKAMSNK